MAKKSTKQWFEREEFWNNFGPIMFDAQRWAEAPDVAEAVKKICGLKKGSSILDAGCGPGRISLELAKLDLKVTGVDLIQSELDAAEESAQDEGVKIDFVKADLRNYSTKKKFDAAVNLFNSFGCDDSQKHLRQSQGRRLFCNGTQLPGNRNPLLYRRRMV